MQRDKHSKDDLAYLASQGFETMPLNRSDLDELVKRVRSRSFSYNSGIYFTMLSVLVGIFIGLSLFFVFYKAPPERIKVESSIVEDKTKDPKPGLKLVQLAPVTITLENFVATRSAKPRASDAVASTAAVSYMDSALVVSPLAVSLPQPLREEKLKFIVNAPVIYIHDLKVTDYTSLYFKKNQFLRVNGTSALYTTQRDAQQNRFDLKEHADYFLHQELADALFDFKKGAYDRCLYSLDNVAAYNKEDLNCNFYRGMCYYYKKNYLKSIFFFDQCIGCPNNAFLQEAMYYKAISLNESGQKERALSLFSQIADEEGFYAEKAKTALNAH